MELFFKMSDRITIQTVNDLIRTNIAKKSYERLGNRMYKQNVLTVNNKKYQLTKNMISGAKPLSKGIINAVRDLIPAIPFAGVAQNMRAKRALTSYAIRDKATIGEREEALLGYTNSKKNQILNY